MTDNGMTPNDPESTQSSNELALTELTDQNWLFIKHYIESGDVVTAYQMAKYEGACHSAPYQLFKRLKPYIEELLSVGKVSRLALMADLEKALKLPLAVEQMGRPLTVSEWLRVRKFASSLIPELKQDSKVSLLVVNRYASSEGNTDKGEKGNNVTPSINPKDVIDIEPLQ